MRALAAIGFLGTVLCVAACGNTSRDEGSGGQPFGGTGGTSGAGGSSGVGGTSGVGGGGTSGSGGVPGLTVTDKVDLLLVVDNSISMADKQQVLVESVPRLVQRLVAPRCLDAGGNPTGGVAPCPAGTTPEFPPIVDIHVGVISSSLGGHGGNVCSDVPPANDRGHLLPDVRPGLPHAGNGFLTWQAGTDPGQLVGELAQHVTAAGELGCGFEAPLESWYRFLVDPNPPENVVMDGGATVAVGTDSTVLSQRAAFLRPDSLLAIVLLSDENDCSIRDSDVGWYVSTISSPNGTPYPLAKPTAVCATDPNSPCCRSCADVSQVPGCPSPDPSCDGTQLDPASTDKVNLRCWQQKRRFGIDFLYPTDRYVNALRRSQLCTSSPDLAPEECDPSALAPNPLFMDLSGQGKPTRGSELVVFMSIVGVPWQDLATSSSLGDPNALSYLSAPELAAQGRWAWISGDYATPPGDPLMIEATEPRSGTSPATGEALAPPTAEAGANTANGHEWNPDSTAGGDLQYACIFPLAVPRDCDAITGGGCDCKAVDAEVSAGTYARNSPLCQQPGSGPGAGYSSVQYSAKAYPGLRYMDVAQRLEAQAVVASICPKLVDPASPAFGYNPAVEALIAAMRPRLLP